MGEGEGSVNPLESLLRVVLALAIVGDPQGFVAPCPEHGNALGDIRGDLESGQLLSWQCGEVAACTGRQSQMWALYETLCRVAA